MHELTLSTNLVDLASAHAAQHVGPMPPGASTSEAFLPGRHVSLRVSF